MRRTVMKRYGLVALLLCSSAVAQVVVSFDVQAPTCGPVFPTPCGAAGDPEGVSWNGTISGVGALPSPIAACVDGNPNGVGMAWSRAPSGRIPAGCARARP